MNYTGFWGFEAGYEALAAALHFMRDSQAMIIDLRENGGGGADMVQFLARTYLKIDR